MSNISDSSRVLFMRQNIYYMSPTRVKFMSFFIDHPVSPISTAFSSDIIHVELMLVVSVNITQPITHLLFLLNLSPFSLLNSFGPIRYSTARHLRHVLLIFNNPPAPEHCWPLDSNRNSRCITSSPLPSGNCRMRTGNNVAIS